MQNIVRYQWLFGLLLLGGAVVVGAAGGPYSAIIILAGLFLATEFIRGKYALTLLQSPGLLLFLCAMQILFATLLFFMGVGVAAIVPDSFVKIGWYWGIMLTALAAIAPLAVTSLRYSNLTKALQAQHAATLSSSFNKESK
jgi:hypothetical protein